MASLTDRLLTMNSFTPVKKHPAHLTESLTQPTPLTSSNTPPHRHHHHHRPSLPWDLWCLSEPHNIVTTLRAGWEEKKEGASSGQERTQRYATGCSGLNINKDIHTNTKHPQLQRLTQPRASKYMCRHSQHLAVYEKITPLCMQSTKEMSKGFRQCVSIY